MYGGGGGGSRDDGLLLLLLRREAAVDQDRKRSFRRRRQLPSSFPSLLLAWSAAVLLLAWTCVPRAAANERVELGWFPILDVFCMVGVLAVDW